MTGSSRARDTICPSWCQLPPGDAAHLGAAGGITHLRIVSEIRLTGVEATREAADQPVMVAVEAYSDPEGRQYAPTVRLTPSSAAGSGEPYADDLTPAEARGLAAALLEAARLAES
jgi:Domain of unknown function (DUF6907)